MDLPIELLRTFVAAADTENFTAAGNIVHRTQSAVSMQMKRLEELLGHPLFRRNGHSMQLTSHGQTLLRYARRLLQLNDEAAAAIVNPEMSGRVRLGAPEDYAEKLLPEVLAKFAETYPLVEVDVSCASGKTLMYYFDRGELDLLVRVDGEVPQRGQIVHREPLVWITSNKHLVHEQDPVPLAVYAEDCIYREWATSSLRSIGRDYRIAYSSPGIAGILAAVRGGLAVAVTGINTLTSGLRILATAEGYPELPMAVISLLRAPGPLSPAVESLTDHVMESIKGMGGFH